MNRKDINIYSVQFYLGTQMNNIMTPVRKSMDLEIIMLSDFRLT